jgi:uncharacterized phage protein (predicted DNA packaging)
MADVVVLTVGPLYTLAEVKAQLAVDFTDDDTLIQTYMDAAESAVLEYCNISFVPVGKEAVFKTAAMITVTDLYENRRGGEGLPRAAQMLIEPYRWLRV